MRIFGVLIDGPAYVFFENQYVKNDVTLTQPVPNKRHNAICYHIFRETQAAEIIIFGWIQGEYSQSDLKNNITLSTKRSYKLVKEIMCKYGFTKLN